MAEHGHNIWVQHQVFLAKHLQGRNITINTLSRPKALRVKKLVLFFFFFASIYFTRMAR